ncbi:sugar phosphate isomerase/epimerase [Candidatus Dojkabacteria bacterium]|nr:sugar phosphate isomerase/epimerase [Candidatus Dojkabacteria bacterium]
MNLAISNIAWENSENETVYNFMQENNFHGLEIAPTKVWGDISKVSKEELVDFERTLKKYQICPVAMQSLLFGKPELNIWDREASRKKILQYLFDGIKITGDLGIRALVFGSPKNRIIPKGLKQNEIHEIGGEFFGKLANFAENAGTNVCIEPNPAAYGTNFLNTTIEALDFVKKINHLNLKINIDSGTIALNKEDLSFFTLENIKYIGHVHISEPFLAPVDPTNTYHEKIHTCLREFNYKEWVSIEMKNLEGNNIGSIKNAITFVRKLYR